MHQKQTVWDPEALRLEDRGGRTVEELVATRPGLVLGDPEETTQLTEPRWLAAGGRRAGEPLRHLFTEGLARLALDGHRDSPLARREQAPQIGLGRVPTAIELDLVLRDAQQEPGAGKLGPRIQKLGHIARQAAVAVAGRLPSYCQLVGALAPAPVAVGVSETSPPVLRALRRYKEAV